MDARNVFFSLRLSENRFFTRLTSLPLEKADAVTTNQVAAIEMRLYLYTLLPLSSCDVAATTTTFFMRCSSRSLHLWPKSRTQGSAGRF